MTIILKIKIYTTVFRKSKRFEKIFEKIKKSDGMPSDFLIDTDSVFSFLAWFHVNAVQN